MEGNWKAKMVSIEQWYSLGSSGVEQPKISGTGLEFQQDLRSAGGHKRFVTEFTGITVRGFGLGLWRKALR